MRAGFEDDWVNRKDARLNKSLEAVAIIQVKYTEDWLYFKVRKCLACARPWI
jgi:hypothetical protein